MPPKTLDLKGMGAVDAEAAAAQAQIEAREVSLLKSYQMEACVECGVFGPWYDGDFHYCKDHVPHNVRYRAAYWDKLKEKYDGHNAAGLIAKLRRDLDP